MAKHVAVLIGGWSSERQVSLWSGTACTEVLRQAGYQVTPIDVGRDVATRLAEVKPDVAFIALHGQGGEDGTIQGLLEVMAIPYTHSGVLASALSMDKQAAKKLGGRVDPVDVHITASPTLAVVHYYERGENVIDGTPQPVDIRATTTLRKEGGQWKVIGHHTDTLGYLRK
jgi:D-alanine--D-alanine ligase